MKTSSQIRDAFRDFFAARGHEKLKSGPIVPANDPTLMFANAGMVQFKDVFIGAETRPYKRATTSQKCLRVSGKHNDLENVGVTARHHTFFEMLGNFSFGDYFKEDAIKYAWDFLTQTLGIPKDKLIVSVFGGEDGLPADTEAEKIWHEVAGIPKDRIIRLGKADNFWSMGDTGPCGPCTEIHYFFGSGTPDVARFGQEPDEAGNGWVEIWNNVFMQFERKAGGELIPLPAQSVDTGMGLERVSCVVQGVFSNYDTDLLRPVVDLAAKISKKSYGGTLAPDDVSMRVIADHARAAAFLISEGVFPDRDGRPYVLRRIMRRAIRHGHRLGIEQPFLHECALLVADNMGGEYSELRERRALIADITKQEEERFRATLKRGLDRLSDAKLDNRAGVKTLTGAQAFELYDTYGFPLDLQEVLGREQGFAIDDKGFEQELERARERSQGSKVGEAAVDAVYKQLGDTLPKVTFLGYDAESAESEVLALVTGGAVVNKLSAGQAAEIVTAKTPFYGESGGQVGDQGVIKAGDALFRVTDTLKPREGLFVHKGTLEKGSIEKGQKVQLEVDSGTRSATRRNHSATHLLHLALRSVVGPQAMQKGSLVGPDRLRFDYSAATPLTEDQIARIEDIVNERILRNADVTTDVLGMNEAKERGAIGIFEEKYGDVVRMLTIADSKELCGGTHVRRTGDIGSFKVLSDSGIAAGVRRIEAATGVNALAYTRELERELSRVASAVKGTVREAGDKVQKLLERQREQQREIDALKKKLTSGGSRDLSENAREIGGMKVLGALVDLGDAKALRDLSDNLRDKLAPAVIVLGSKAADGRALLVCAVSKELTGRVKAGDVIKELAAMVGGGGGGRPDFAQAGGSDPDKLEAAVARVYDLVVGK